MFKSLLVLLAQNNGKTISDEEVVSEYLKTNNNYYFEVLYERYSSKIFGKCLTLLKDEYRAQDAMQDIMMKILLNLSRFSFKSKFSTWVYSITYNFCIDLIRKKKKDKSELVDDISVLADRVEEISDKHLLELKLERLKTVLNGMAASDKAILLMKYMDGLSIKEIAEVTGKSESAVKMKIKRAKERCVRSHKEKFN